MKCRRIDLVCMIALMAMVSQSGAEVKVWELPEGKPVSLELKDGWKEADSSSRFEAGAAVENEWLTVLVGRGGSGPVVRARTGNVIAGTAILDGNGATGDIVQVRVGDCDAMEAILHVRAGLSEYSLVVRSGGPYVGFLPVTNAIRLEVTAPARYAVVPNFYGADTVYGSATNKDAGLLLEPKPMLVEFLRGSDGILGLIWDGGVGEKDGKKSDKKTWEPRRIELQLTGEGAGRVFEKARIEFRGKPLYTGLLAARNVWQEIPRSELDGFRPPFSAVWRTNSVENGAGSVIVHPFDRNEKTPLDMFVVEDLLRRALGTGPCELDWWRPMVR